MSWSASPVRLVVDETREARTSSAWWPGPGPGKRSSTSSIRLSADSVPRENGNTGVAMPADEIAVPVLVAGKDRNTRGFPCLSHLSFSLLHGAVNLLAVYRSHDFISRGYGNYLGLGRVLQFVAEESSLPAGELTCVSASATAEINRGASFGRDRVEALLEDCRAALGVAK